MRQEGYRHELKFICSEAEMQLLERYMQAVCQRDSYVNEQGVYAIRSLYFDTYQDSCFHENMSGVDIRHKYRIRCYRNAPDLYKLERKSSVRGLKRKEACLITKEQCNQLANGETVDEIAPEQQVLKEFLAEQSMTMLRPKVTVEYERTPYVYPVGNVRITFDRYITASGERDFFDDCGPKRCVMPAGMHVLEVKYDEVLPANIMLLLQGVQNLQRTSFSKYAMCRMS